MATGMRRRTKERVKRPHASRKDENGGLDDANGTVERSPKPKLAERAPEGASTDMKLVLGRFWKIASPYWTDPEVRGEALMRAGLLIGITVATTGISVWFNFLGRDFYNALAEKDVSRFWTQLTVYLGAFVVGIPVFVFRDYYQSILGLKWREWMTDKYLGKYFANRKYYDIQSKQMVDNPDQRINDDIRAFTDTALGFFLTIFNSILDLISFSAIMFSIYPPLFLALLVYALGGTAISLWLGRNLVVLNFMQEQREADFRYSLVRIRENAESIAFYKGETNEKKILLDRFSSVLDNFFELVTTSRNLNFFTSFYRLLIQLVPLAVVAPQYFKGAIELGVVNQSSSAFNHILSDVSLVVYQIETIAGLSAVVDRLGEFVDVLESTPEDLAKDGQGRIEFSVPEAAPGNETLLQVKDLTLKTPNYLQTLFCNLDFSIAVGGSLLIMGPSGSGKTSLLRVLAGLWDSGEGEVRNFAHSHAVSSASSYTGTFFLPQRPYMVLGTLREQLLYPTWTTEDEDSASMPAANFPPDEYLVEAMQKVQLGYLLDRLGGLDERADWSAMLSLGEQQRLAFARLLLARPSLALMDECTSAMDEENEMQLYNVLARSGITYISIGHRSSLKKYHKRLLRFSPNKSEGGGAPWRMEDIPEARNEQLSP